MWKCVSHPRRVAARNAILIWIQKHANSRSAFSDAVRPGELTIGPCLCYIRHRRLLWRSSIIGNAAVLKTAALTGLQVRVLSSPPASKKTRFSRVFCLSLLITMISTRVRIIGNAGVSVSWPDQNWNSRPIKSTVENIPHRSGHKESSNYMDIHRFKENHPGSVIVHIVPERFSDESASSLSGLGSYKDLQTHGLDRKHPACNECDSAKKT